MRNCDGNTLELPLCRTLGNEHLIALKVNFQCTRTHKKNGERGKELPCKQESAEKLSLLQCNCLPLPFHPYGHNEPSKQLH